MAKVDSLESSMIKTESTTELKMEDPDEKINSSASSIWKIFQLCVSLLLGFLFGFALEKTRGGSGFHFFLLLFVLPLV